MCESVTLDFISVQTLCNHSAATHPSSPLGKCIQQQMKLEGVSVRATLKPNQGATIGTSMAEYSACQSWFDLFVRLRDRCRSVLWLPLRCISHIITGADVTEEGADSTLPLSIPPWRTTVRRLPKYVSKYSPSEVFGLLYTLSAYVIWELRRVHHWASCWWPFHTKC